MTEQGGRERGRPRPQGRAGKPRALRPAEQVPPPPEPDPTPSTGTPNPIREAARRLAKLGYRPLPVKPGEKHPYLKWTRYRDAYDFLRVAAEFTPDRGIWSPMGLLVSRVTLDCDDEAAIRLWRERLGEDLERTAIAATRKGRHYVFLVPEGHPPIRGWTWRTDPEAVERGAHYELMADGQGVILPPSRHAEDPSFVYRWERLPETAIELPAALLAYGPDGSGAGAGTKRRRKPTSASRSMLAKLLAEPAPEGGRNDWHARVAGHLVKVLPHQDAYEAMALALNSALSVPLEEEEVLKTWRHRWESEQDKKEQPNPTAETGWLAGDGSQLMCLRRWTTADERKMEAPAPWANADLIARGVIDSPTGRTYVVTVQRQDGLVWEGLIPPGLLGSQTDTSRWLASHGVSVVAPSGDVGKQSGHAGQRILRYLESQKPSHYRSVPHLGWHADIGFVTNEGVIGPHGIRPHEAVMLDPALTELVPYRYGMGEAGTARLLLAELLTFQDPMVTAVFGAWWAASRLKGQIFDAVGHFPYFLVTAASEAGKTRGFFRMMLKANGLNQFGIGTKASVRDYIGAHRSGIVHVDDPEQVDNLAELLRAAPGEATITKKSKDATRTIEIKLVAPILLSGEALGLVDEKAQRDRVVQIEVPSPIGRMSYHDPNRPQIDDILALEREHDLTDYAGTYVQLALQQADRLDLPTLLAELRGSASRQNEIKAILRLGARILAGMLADQALSAPGGGTEPAGSLVTRVDEWCAAQVDLGAANTLLTKVLPWALSDFRWRALDGPITGPPAYIDPQRRIWVNPQRLAAEWQEALRRRGASDRLSGEDALRAQLRSIGATKSAPQWISGLGRDGRRSGGRRARYWLIPDEYAADLLDEIGPEGGQPPPPESPEGGPRYRPAF